VWSGLNWLTTISCVEFLWIHQCTFGFHKSRGVSWPNIRVWRKNLLHKVCYSFSFALLQRFIFPHEEITITDRKHEECTITSCVEWGRLISPPFTKTTYKSLDDILKYILTESPLSHTNLQWLGVPETAQSFTHLWSRLPLYVCRTETYQTEGHIVNNYSSYKMPTQWIIKRGSIPF
jgi:hypothetical protein